MFTDWSSKRITVMGLGRFGGGAGVARWLAHQGAKVLITDLQPEGQLRDSIDDIRDLIDRGAVTLKLGRHDLLDFTSEGCDAVIANPAVPKPWENSYLKAAADSGVPITAEIELVIRRLNRKRVIGVTGSAGKSTTAAMIHHIFTHIPGAGFRSHLGGNIGGSLLNHLDDVGPNDWVVLELSSAMLYWLGGKATGNRQQATGNGQHIGGGSCWSPKIAVMTNIAPNHIDWHGTFEHYRESKLNLCRFQTPDDHCITGEHIPLPSTSNARQTIVDSSSTQSPLRLEIPGTHNQLNARMAITAATCALESEPSFDFRHVDVSTLLNCFPGLPHRLQLVCERDGLRFYNDSKCTTPQATVLAVEAFDDSSRVHLVAGGYDKGSDLSPIAKLTERIAGLYTIGKTGASLAASATESACGFAQYCETLEGAVARALKRMTSGDILVLSPGCASWDQFTNYEQRGDEFVRLVSRSPDSAGHAHPARSDDRVRAGS